MSAKCHDLTGDNSLRVIQALTPNRRRKLVRRVLRIKISWSPLAKALKALGAQMARLDYGEASLEGPSICPVCDLPMANALRCEGCNFEREAERAQA